MAKSVIIVGAGLGGLAAAAALAQRGFDVTVLEKNAQAGGKVSEFRASGFRWDIAPMPFAPKRALAALYHDCALDMSDYLRLQPITPQSRYFFPDGRSFSARRDWAALVEEINQAAPDDYIGFLEFLADAARMESPLAALNRDSSGLSGFRYPPRRTMRQAIDRHIKSDKLRQILGNSAATVGGSPFALPAEYAALAHDALSEGRWYPQGGMPALTTTLQQLARKHGADLKLNNPIRSLRIAANEASGVVLADGQTLPADAVVSNVDVISTLRFLLPEGALPAPAQRRLNRAKMSSSAFFIMLGVRGSFPQLAHHNIFFSHDPRREFQDIFQRDLMPADPTITLTITSKSEPLSAPVNQENWLIRVAAPPLSEKFDWAANREGYRDRVLSILHQRFGLDLSDRIRVEKHVTPADFHAMTGAWRGALFGQSAHQRNAPIGVSDYRSTMFSRLYFAGGTTHPGGDNALGIQSGLLAARAVAEDLK